MDNVTFKDPGSDLNSVLGTPNPDILTKTVLKVHQMYVRFCTLATKSLKLSMCTHRTDFKRFTFFTYFLLYDTYIDDSLNSQSGFILIFYYESLYNRESFCFFFYFKFFFF